MIKQLILKNFKCFDDIKMDFSDVNILTGLNGMGKSTVIQGILLLGQSQKSIMADGTICLQGKYVNLGTGRDILYEKADSDEIGIAVETEEKKESCLMNYQPDANILSLRNVNGEGEGNYGSGWRDRLYFLSAYRIEPQLLYHIENERELSERYFGKNGEFAIQYLKMHGSEEVKNKGVMLGERSTILDQVKAWMDTISPGISPVININMSSRTAELQYEYIEGREKTNSYRSVNVGFGITYVLPVVVALTAARPGDILLIENPEAHIHPRGQRMLGELMAAAGAGGVQIIVETHSDHILNGIRVRVKKGMLKPEKTKIFFFYKDRQDAYRHKAICPSIDKNGRISEWPEGFFDEWDNALLELL